MTKKKKTGKMTKKIDESFQFRGKSIFSKEKSELLKKLKNRFSRGNDLILLFTPNPEQIMLAEADSDFNEVLQAGDILIPDGTGLIIASKILQSNSNPIIKERIPGRMLVEDILLLSKKMKLTVLVIGGRDYTHTGKFTLLGQTVHWTPGYLDVHNPTVGEEVALQETIKQIQPDIVFVAFGAPQQETWLVKNKPVLSESGVSLGMAVGGSFDYLLGKVPRTPHWVSKRGFEWLFRLVTQPWRFTRQLSLLSFIFLVLEEKWQSS